MWSRMGLPHLCGGQRRTSCRWSSPPTLLRQVLSCGSCSAGPSHLHPAVYVGSGEINSGLRTLQTLLPTELPLKVSPYICVFEVVYNSNKQTNKQASVYVCVRMCMYLEDVRLCTVHAHVCVRVSVLVTLHMRKPEKEAGIFHCALESGSLTEPGARLATKEPQGFCVRQTQR